MAAGEALSPSPSSVRRDGSSVGIEKERVSSMARRGGRRAAGGFGVVDVGSRGFAVKDCGWERTRRRMGGVKEQEQVAAELHRPPHMKNRTSSTERNGRQSGRWHRRHLDLRTGISDAVGGRRTYQETKGMEVVKGRIERTCLSESMMFTVGQPDQPASTEVF